MKKSLKIAITLTTITILSYGAYHLLKQRDLKEYPYAYKALKDNSPKLEDSLNPEDEIGIVLIDMQDHFLTSINKIEKEEEIQNQKEILATAIEFDIPVIVFEYIKCGKTTEELKKIVEKVPRHEFYTKGFNSGFLYLNHFYPNKEDPAEWLKSQGVNTLYFMGINTDACVNDTAKDAHELYDFKIITTKDVIATFNCYDNCNSVYRTFNFFAKEGYLGESHYEFIDLFE